MWQLEPLEMRVLLSALSVSPGTGQQPIPATAVTAEGTFSFAVLLDTTGGSGQTATSDQLTLRLHFDSSVLAFNKIAGAFNDDGATVSPVDLTTLTVQEDTANLDSDAATTHFVEVTFTFPDGAPADAQLFTATFDSIDEDSATTNIKFSGAVDTEDTFAGAPLQVNVIGPDLVPPQPVIAGPTGPIGLAPFSVTIDFGEPVVVFLQDEVTVTGGTVTNMTTDGQGKYTVAITPSGEGPLTVNVAAGVVQDNGSNASLAAEPFSVTVVGQDFGDAPDSYDTSLNEDGPRHFGTGPTLGDSRDVESNAPSPLNGSGDDADGNTSVTVTQLSEEIITLHTNGGSIFIQMIRDGEDAPEETVENFLNYVRDGSYVNSIFHRYVTDFVLQGGGFKTTSNTFTNTSQFTAIATDPPVVNEFDPDRSNLRGTVAMAKLGSSPDSATSQFFFNLGDNSENLDDQNGGFTVFARVLNMDLIDSILESFSRKNAGGAFTDLPVTASNQLLVVRAVGVGNVSGVAYTDANGNGVRDAGEAGLGGAVIYVDANKNNKRDSGELVVTTAADGSYEIEGVPLGENVIRYDVPASRFQTGPFAPSGYTINVDIGDQFAHVDFGSMAASDAPAFVPAGDEDGVVISGDFRVITGETDSAVVNIQHSTGNARLYAWIDLNRDGDFGDAGEQIANGTGQFANLGNGQVVVPFTVPASASEGYTYARFRVSTDTGLGSKGLASDGEVEDYAVLFDRPQPIPTPGSLDDRDFDGDGEADSAIYDSETGRWSVALTGGGSMSWDDFTAPAGVSTSASGRFDGGRATRAEYMPLVGLWQIDRLADTDGDGQGDTLIHTFWPQFDTAAGWTQHVTGDFNGDRLPVVANYNPQLGAWWVSIAADSNSDGDLDTFITVLRSSLDTSAVWTEQVVADYNGDGFLDIANYHAGTGRWWISTATDNNDDGRPDAFVTRGWKPPSDDVTSPQPATFSGVRGNSNPAATVPAQLAAPTMTTLEDVLNWLDSP
jgi:cyclophilin family peptidyl-prolyl cis-trans isomerase